MKEDDTPSQPLLADEREPEVERQPEREKEEQEVEDALPAFLFLAVMLSVAMFGAIMSSAFLYENQLASSQPLNMMLILAPVHLLLFVLLREFPDEYCTGFFFSCQLFCGILGCYEQASWGLDIPSRHNDLPAGLVLIGCVLLSPIYLYWLYILQNMSTWVSCRQTSKQRAKGQPEPSASQLPVHVV